MPPASAPTTGSSSPTPAADGRAVSPVVGVAVLLAVTVVLAAVVGATALGTTSGTDPPPRATVAVTADAAAATVTLTHRGGEPIDVGDLRLRVTVDGTPLRHQPPVPFFAARGFRGGPSGPINPASDDTWSAGEAATLRLAGTNHPTLSAGATVSVRLYAEGALVARGETRASG